MSAKEIAHRDCRNYVPVDAAKGLCRRSKNLLPADGDICKEFRRLPRCRVCAHFQATSENSQSGLDNQIGVCLRSVNQFLAYADMTAATCRDFQLRE